MCWVLHKDGGMETRRWGREEEEAGQGKTQATPHRGAGGEQA